MRLRSLALNQFKKFTSPRQLRNIEDGLNIVVGPNEMGKSTLLDALRAVLFEKYNSKAQPIKALQNDRNQAGPVVELSFELDDGDYRIIKRFIKKPYAHLYYPDGRGIEGDAAEDNLRELLDFTEPGHGGAKPETLGMWNVLWVKQGQSFTALDLPESARSNLHVALESEVGTVLGGRRGRDLPQTIQKQLGELVTSRGPRGKYKAVVEQADFIQNELGELENRRKDLSDTLDELEESLNKLERLTDKDLNEAEEKELEEVRNDLGELAELGKRIDDARKELKIEELRLERLTNTEEQRRELEKSITEEETALGDTREELEKVCEREKKLRSDVTNLEETINEAEEEADNAREVVLRKSRIHDAVQLKTLIDGRQDRWEKVQDAEERQRLAQQRAASTLVTDEIIEQIRIAQKKLEKTANRLDAVATRIAFDIKPERFSEIEIDGARLSPDRLSVQAVESTRITVSELGNITVEPAVKNRDKLISEKHEAEEGLENALNRAGALDVKDAEDQHRERKRALEDADLARREAELHAPPNDEHEAGADALADYIKGHRQILKRKMDELELQELPSHQEIETELENAEKRDDEARRALDAARAELKGPQETLGELKGKLAVAKDRQKSGNERLSDLRKQLEEAEEEYPNAELLSDIEAAGKKLSDQKNIVAELQDQHNEETIARLEARAGRLKKTIRNRKEKRQELREKISGLKSRVDVLEGAGLDEAIGKNRRELEFHEEEKARYEREKNVLTLLLSTLREAEREAKKHYLSPVVDRLRPYLRLLFPGAEIMIDENLHITGVIRESGYEESFSHLSMGTQEQIAVLVRLAFAKMLVEQGRPAAVVLDDALVFSDDTRIRRMFDILNVAAQDVQVLIFTCREQLFEGLGGRHLSLEPGDPEELMSA